MRSFTEEIREQLKLYNKYKQLNSKTDHNSDRTENLTSEINNHSNTVSESKSYVFSKSLRNDNNVKTTKGDIFTHAKDDFSDMDEKDAFGLYMKMMKQLRYNRTNQLRSVSCQSDFKTKQKDEKHIKDGKLLPGQRSRSLNRRDTPFVLSGRSTSNTSSSPRLIKTPSTSLVNTTKLYGKSLTHNEQKILFNYSKIKQLLLTKIAKSSNIQQLESLFRLLSGQIQRKYGIKDLYKLDKRIINHLNGYIKTKSQTKAIQVKSENKTKPSDVNPVSLLSYYIDSLAKYIQKNIKNEIFETARNKLVKKIERNQKRVESIAEKNKIQMKKQMKSKITRIKSNQYLTGSNESLKTCSVHQLNSKETELVETNHKFVPSIVNLPFSCVPTYHANSYCDNSIKIINKKIFVKENNQMIKQTPVKEPKSFSTIFQENSLISQISSTSSCIDSVSLIDSLNCQLGLNINSSINGLENKIQFVIKESQPIILHDSHFVNFSPPAIDRTICPKISIEPCLTEIDKSSFPTMSSDAERSEISNSSTNSKSLLNVKLCSNCSDSLDMNPIEEISSNCHPDFNTSNEVCRANIKSKDRSLYDLATNNFYELLKIPISNNESFKSIIPLENKGNEPNDTSLSTMDDISRNNSFDTMATIATKKTKFKTPKLSNGEFVFNRANEFFMTFEVTTNQMISSKETLTTLVSTQRTNSPSCKGDIAQVNKIRPVEFYYTISKKNVIKKPPREYPYTYDCVFSNYDFEPFSSRCGWKSLFKNFLQPWLGP